MFIKKNNLLSGLQISFYFFPIILICGSLIVNLYSILFILIASIYLLIDKIKIQFNFINISLFLFFLTTIFTSFLNIEIVGQDNFIKSIFLLRFFLLFILIETLFFNKKINLKYFFYACFFTTLFLSIDLCLQFFYGKNILGFEPWEGRVTGVFRSEAIAGAYIQKMFIFLLIFFFLITKNLNNKYLPIILFLLIIIIFSSFISNNRISFLILILTLLFVIIFYKTLRKKLLICFLILLPIFIYFFKNNSQINSHYVNFIDRIILVSKLEKNFDLLNKKQTEYAIDSNKNIAAISLPEHFKIYTASIESFKENKLLGNGLKSFRFKCQKFQDQKKFLCSTHPHNFHLEILHDAGLIGFFFISFFSVGLIIKITKHILFKNTFYEEKIILSLILLNFLIEIFPLKSTGSFFTTWNGTILWFSIALVNYNNYVDYYDEKKLL